MSERSCRLVPLVVVAAAIVSSGPERAAAADDAEAVPDVPEAFEVCISCHAIAPDETPLEGPSLWQVMGRRIASLDSYDYSPALRKIGGSWDRPTLDRFLAAPQAFAPGVRMTFGGVRNAADRAIVLDFLETLAPGADSQRPEADR